jgi:glycosyltransferase involved in cell wall biosynthesis
VGPDRGLEQPDGSKLGILRYLAEHVPEPSIRERVEVLGPQPLAAIPALRRRAALTLVGSRYENAPLAVVEALAFGSPLVASDAGGIPELVRPGETGLLFRSGDAADFAAKVDAVLAMPDRGASLGAAGRRDYEARLTIQAVAEQTAEYYRQVLA